MLNKQAIPATLAGVYTAAHIDGRALDRLLRVATASQKALVADDLHTGRLVVSPLTARQSRLLAKASQGYTCTASKLTEAERTAIINGQMSLSALHHKPSVWAALARAYNEVWDEVDDGGSISVGDLVDRAMAKIDRASLHDALDRMAKHVPDEMMAALDRVTAPTTTTTTVKTNGNGHANDNELAGQMAFSL